MPTMCPALTGTSRTQAKSLIEALFPAGDALPAADVEELLSAVDTLLADNPGLRRTLVGMLWGLEWRYRLSHGLRFSQASRTARSSFLRAQSQQLVAGGFLHLLSVPFRTAYLLNASTQAPMKLGAGIRVPSSLESARWREQVSTAESFNEHQTIECDVVVIGTGAGGAAAAYELATQGLAVVILEEGHYYDRRDFTGKASEMVPRLYRNMGATMAIGSTIIPIPIGRSVGGTTTINSGTCLRTPESTLAAWRSEGLSEFSSESLLPYFEQVEAILKVQRADARYVGAISTVMTEGARRIGMVNAMPLTRNAEGCDGQGVCYLGCPTDAKQSTNVSFIPRALEAGAFLFTGFRADTLLRDDAEVSGVRAEGIGSDGKRITLTIKARATVVSMGALMTPVFLRSNGVRNAWLGKNLSIHPAGVVMAHFPDIDFNHEKTIPQGFGIYDLKEDGLMFEGCTLPFIAHGMLNTLQAEEFVKFTERYQQTAYFGLMIKDSSRGKVRRGPIRDFPLVTYHMNDADFGLFKKGIHHLVRMYFSAGAAEVCIPGLTRMTVLQSQTELEEFMASKPGRHHFSITAHHPLGTARISSSAVNGVCDHEHKVWGVDGLYVMDGASVPSSLGANPQVTIMSMAMRAAQRLAQKLNS